MLRLLLTNLFLASTIVCYSQNIDTLAKNIQDIPGKYYSKVDEKLTTINERLTKKSLKYLVKFQKQEKKLQEKLKGLNTTGENLLTAPTEEYNQFISRITSKVAKATGERSAYNSYLDTLSTSLSFLKKLNVPSAGKPAESLKELQNKLLQSEKMKEFIAGRKQQIKEALSRYTKLPQSLKKQYDKLNKTAYYYSAQVNEYKEMLKDPSKAERKALSLLNKLPAFQKFMKKNSQLTSLFRVPNDNEVQRSFAGLQTRASVQNIITQQLGGSSNVRQIIQQNLAQAKNELNKLQDRLNQLGGSGNDIEAPDFKPNNQKAKNFLKRLELGFNIQSQKGRGFFPSSSDLGLSLGYKLNDKSIFGIGMSYKMGIGSIRRVVISHKGIGVRSFLDYKIKNSFYMSGGFEMNYNAAFKNIEQLKKFNEWQSCGLIGLSKKYNMSKKVTGEMRLVYDFFANLHRPVSQPIVFRIGYFVK